MSTDIYFVRAWFNIQRIREYIEFFMLLDCKV